MDQFDPSMETPAETIRRAAKQMMATADAATQGPWEHPMSYEVTHGYRQDGPRHIATWIATADAGDSDIEDEQASANAEHMASWHPLVARAVAVWLEEVADGRHPELPAWVDDGALRIAHVYLGECLEGGASDV